LADLPAEAPAEMSLEIQVAVEQAVLQQDSMEVLLLPEMAQQVLHQQLIHLYMDQAERAVTTIHQHLLRAVPEQVMVEQLLSLLPILSSIEVEVELAAEMAESPTALRELQVRLESSLSNGHLARASHSPTQVLQLLDPSQR
jgi:hypothetical protein